MSVRYWRKKAVLAKIETGYGVDAAPLATANAMVVSDVTQTPLAGEEISRDLYVPWLGEQKRYLVGNYATLAFSVEFCGSGTAGTAPKWGALLRACGFAETVAAGTQVIYELASEGHESLSFYYYDDGVLHVMLGARGTVRIETGAKQILRLAFTFTGLLGPISDAALPSVTYTGWIEPDPISKVLTTFSLHGYAAGTERITLDVGNVVGKIELINREAIEITDRKVNGSVVIEAPLLAQKNFFATALAHTTGPIALTHGTVPGKITGISGPALQIGRPTTARGNDGKSMLTVPFWALPDAGDDELTFFAK